MLHPSLYGLLVGIGFTFSAVLAEYLLTQSAHTSSTRQRSPQKHPRHIPTHFLRESEWLGLLLSTFIAGTIGARLYHLATDWPRYTQAPWWSVLAVWEGGIGILGALWGGLVGILLWYHFARPNWPRLLLLDALGIAVPFGQAIGRWGNYANQELFGPPTALPWGIEIPIALRPERFVSAERFHPLFLYESLALIATGVFLLQLWRLGRKIPQIEWLELGSGLYLGLYALHYGLIRFFLDFLRFDLPLGWLQLTFSQWGALLLMGIGLGGLARAGRAGRAALTLALLAILLLPARPARAQAPAQLDLSLSPSVVEITAKPGKLITQAIELENAGTENFMVTLTLRDFTSDNRTGVPVLLETNSFPYATLQNADIRWETPFLLKSDSSQQIVLGVDLPDNAETRDWYFVLLAQAQPTGTLAETNFGGTATGTIGSNIIVRVTPSNEEPVTWKLSLGRLPLLMDSLQGLTITPTISNTSRTMSIPDFQLTVLDWRRNTVAEFTNLPERILAQSDRLVEAKQPRRDDPRSFEAIPFRFKPLFALGPYTVHGTIRNGLNAPVVMEHTVWALPFTPLLALLSLFLLWVGLRRLPRRPQKKKSASEHHDHDKHEKKEEREE